MEPASGLGPLISHRLRLSGNFHAATKHPDSRAGLGVRIGTARAPTGIESEVHMVAEATTQRTPHLELRGYENGKANT